MPIKRLIIQASLISKRQLHVISRTTTNIKPASPTPRNLQHHKLPFHDLMMPDYNMAFIFFYPNPPSNKATLSNVLKNSLSKTLSKYYPFAGILGSSGSYVECNDQGVHFIEASIACKLAEVMEEKAPVKEEKEGYGHLFPPCSVWDKPSCSYLMLVQLNHFSCGGIAISVSLSHRIADASSLFSLLMYWASLTRDSNNEDKLEHLLPCFVHDLLPGSFYDDLAAPQFLIPKKDWITREITFHNSKIAELKANQELKDKVHGVECDINYTRNDLVIAIIYRCALAAAATSNSGVFDQSVLLQVVNMRPLIDPPLPKTSIGNLVTFNPVLTSTMSETETNPLVCQMRKGRMKLRGKAEIVPAVVVMDKYIKMSCKMYGFSSICNFPVYDEMDFGWGRPAKATVVDTPPFVNSTIMMDTPSRDGIKAIVALEEEDMKNFLVNKELLTYASV